MSDKRIMTMAVLTIFCLFVGSCATAHAGTFTLDGSTTFGNGYGGSIALNITHTFDDNWNRIDSSYSWTADPITRTNRDITVTFEILDWPIVTVFNHQSGLVSGIARNVTVPVERTFVGPLTTFTDIVEMTQENDMSGGSSGGVFINFNGTEWVPTGPFITLFAPQFRISGRFHDGLEIGDLILPGFVAIVPEPSSFILCFLAVALRGRCTWRRSLSIRYPST